LTLHDGCFHKYDIFKQMCGVAATAAPAQKLPQYSFVEPRFTPELGCSRLIIRLITIRRTTSVAESSSWRMSIRL
jgi:hypothetical protein